LFEMATGEKADDLKRQMGDISRPAPVPSTAIYSRTDGIANWKFSAADLRSIENETARKLLPHLKTA